MTPILQTAERLSRAPAGAVSIVVIPDTQAYRRRDASGQRDPSAPLANRIFEAHTRWIAENISRQNIIFVSHVGDLVDKNQVSQWEIARQHLDQIHGKVPYGISLGNRDMKPSGDARLFQRYFPAERFRNFPWYGGTFSGSSRGPQFSGNNANSYQRISAGGLDFVFLHLECNAPDDVLEWANDVLAQHADRYAIITSHMGWGPRLKPQSREELATAPKGRMTWHKIHGPHGNSPQQMWEKCYRRHANLLAVFSGDQSRTQAHHAVSPGDHGNRVHEILQDYRRYWLRLYRILPQQQRIEAITFDPRTEALCTATKLVPDRDQHQFCFALPAPPGQAAIPMQGSSLFRCSLKRP